VSALISPGSRDRVRVGLCGFSMAMEDYALHFGVVEIQQTFYQPPRDDTMRRWISATPRGFEFALKAWQLVTHPGSSPTYRRLTTPLTAAEMGGCGFFRDTAAVERGYRRSIECAAVLGATNLLFQCPSSFAPDAENLSRLRRFFTTGPGSDRPAGLRFLWEPRGSKWVEARDVARSIAQELSLVYVVDPFVTPPDAGSPVYWRLHGIGGSRHSYSDAELRRLRSMVDEGLCAGRDGPSYVLFNNLPRVRDARRFQALVGRGSVVGGQESSKPSNRRTR
jgi:uncharacterized protein YecE (DUF72 family)